MLLPTRAEPSPEDTTRRSQRKTKHIDRDRFAKAYSKPALPKRSRQSNSDAVFQSQLQSYCSKMMAVSSRTHEPYLLAEMEKAFREQSDKLFTLCKIKLKLEEQLPVPIQRQPEPAPLILSLEELPESDSPQPSLEDPDSFPWQGLHRAESAKMLCDNYENHELVYSLETLTPKFARQDLDFKFMEELQ